MLVPDAPDDPPMQSRGSMPSSKKPQTGPERLEIALAGGQGAGPACAQLFPTLWAASECVELMMWRGLFEAQSLVGVELFACDAAKSPQQCRLLSSRETQKAVPSLLQARAGDGWEFQG